MRRRSSASAKRCWPSRIRTACAWRSSACQASKASRPGGMAACREHRHPRLPRHQPAARKDGARPRRSSPTSSASHWPGEEDSAHALSQQGTGPGAIIDLRQAGGFLPARLGAGSVHHIAFRAADDAAQAEMVRSLSAIMACASPSRRTATTSARSISASPAASCSRSPPTFRALPSTRPAASLGRDLKLPHFLESRRGDIEARLPALETA